MLTRRYSYSDDEQWAPVSDLMAVVMLIFMLVAMILFVNFDLEQRSNEEQCKETKNMLDSEFRDDFLDWGAILERDLTIRFTNKRVLFTAASSDVERSGVKGGGWFALMLQDFFPRYMSVIKEIRNQFGEEEILAMRIEGHTSSEYETPGEDHPFIRNMELSQARARKILQYVTNPEKVPQANRYYKKVYGLIEANGLSSKQLICDLDGREDKHASRRVEFKLLTNSCQKAGKYDDNQGLVNPCMEEVF